MPKRGRSFRTRGFAGRVPGVGWRSGLASTHPAPRWCAAAMTMCPGTGLLSQMIERGRWPLTPRERACPGLGDPAGLRGRRGSGCHADGGGARLGGEQVPGAGDQLAGDRGGGNLRRAAFGDGGVGGGELRGALGGLGHLVEHPPQPGRALSGMCPCRTVRSEPRTVGVSPAQLASLRALGKREISPISANMTRAVNWPTPGSVAKTLTRGPTLACWRSSPSIRSVSSARASMTARASSVTISRETGGSPGPGQPAAARSGMSTVTRSVSSRAGAPLSSRALPSFQAGLFPDSVNRAW